MKDFQQIKTELYNACLRFVNNSKETVKNSIDSYKNDLFSETKSSAGDKHETGRAMLQLEMEKASQQLESIHQMSNVLEKIDSTKNSNVVCLGSLVVTKNANYYVAISAGKFTINGIDYFAVSTNSPIGQQLLGKKKGDIINFNDTLILKTY
jgi:transcription elongation GreA/GreB family factor